MEAAVEGLPEAEHAAFQPGRGRVTAPVVVGTTRRRWRCRVCQVECGGRDAFREHCGSEEHFDGLQVFGLRPDLFAERLQLA
ncbi:hypothetical protein BAE44_0016424 [Dichanthelium oligosanthes]|uniref:U1-type domain-containing protein n=1 Tax=Dichanthelium oligosanthes TaxID=888268 RepID=A0A1E5VBM5_9POAL|nr:hypothetical protein BAE44_0016424 [Dichanthelium oligosanthes]